MTKHVIITTLLSFILLQSCNTNTKEKTAGENQSVQATLDRTVLPIHEPVYPASTVLDARDAKAPPRFEVKAPDKAPNVVIVLLDDIGFGASSAFGGQLVSRSSRAAIIT
jgi:arylsulfatase